MSRKRKASPRLVAVHWVDAVIHDDPKEATPEDVVTFGLMIGDEDEFVQVASEIFASGSVRQVTAIPKGMIREIIVRPLKLPAEFSGWKAK